MKNKQSTRFIITGLLFIVAAQYPVISFFNLPSRHFFGVPFLLVYMLAIWVVMAVVLIWLTLRLKVKREGTDE